MGVIAEWKKRQLFPRVLSALAPAGGYQSSWGTLLLVLGGMKRDAVPGMSLAENLRRRRKGKVGRSWYVDETYIRVRGGWRYLYRAIDRAGALVDVMLSEQRDLAAAKA